MKRILLLTTLFVGMNIASADAQTNTTNTVKDLLKKISQQAHEIDSLYQRYCELDSRLSSQNDAGVESSTDENGGLSPEVENNQHMTPPSEGEERSAQPNHDPNKVILNEKKGGKSW